MIKNNFYLALFFTALSFVSKGQLPFLTPDERIKFPIMTSVSDSQGNYYATGYEKYAGSGTGKIKTSYHNGLFWVHLPDVYSQDFRYSINNGFESELFQGNLIVAASIKGSPDLPALNNVMRWNGKNWETLGEGILSDFAVHKEVVIHDLQSFKNKLFLSGEYTFAGNKSAKNLAYWNENNWFPVVNSGGYFYTLHVFKDTLYVGGQFNSVGGINSVNLIKYDGNKWLREIFPGSEPVLGLGNYKNNLMALSRNAILIKTDNTWKSYSGWNFETLAFGNFTEFEDKLYLSGTFLNNSTNEVGHLLQWDGIQWKILINNNDLDNISPFPFKVNAFKNMLFFSGDFIKFNGKKVNHVVMLHPDNTLIRGKLFYDKNNNCIFDQHDEILSSRIVSINKGKNFRSTDANGVFELFVPAGACEIEVFTENEEETVCNGKIMVLNNLKSDSAYELNFPFQILQGPAPKLKLSGFSGFKARHGYANSYQVVCNTSGNNNQNPNSLVLETDKELSEFQFDPKPDIISSGKFTWNFRQKDIKVLFTCVNPHDKFKPNEILSMNAACISNFHSNGRRASDTLKQMISAAVDPNDKQCDLPEILSNSEMLNYHIRFQNTGNDLAVNVYIVDTIDPKMPIQYLKVLSTSHLKNFVADYKVVDHVLVYSFRDIYLPYQSVDDKGSNGFVSYKVALGNTLKIGDTLKNKAAIYFDFQPPVLTNLVLTPVVELPLPSYKPGKASKVFPNPAIEEIFIHPGKSRISGYSVYNILGQLLIKDSNEKSGPFSLNVTELAGGIYYLILQEGEITETVKFIKAN